MKRTERNGSYPANVLLYLRRGSNLGLPPRDPVHLPPGFGRAFLVTTLREGRPASLSVQCSSVSLRTRHLAFSLLMLLLPATELWAAGDVNTRYAAALRSHAAGHTEQALEELSALAQEVPASVPVHRALALVALECGEDRATQWKTRLWRRLRRTRRDVGASVGRAVLLQAEGRRSQAHNLLLSALTSGARHPLLVPLLVETSPDRRGLAGWMAARARVLPRDSAFAALRVRYLFAIGQAREAGRLLESSLLVYPQDPDLLSLGADWARANGAEREAARLAALATGLLARTSEVPEVMVPRRLKLARALIAGARLDQARALLGALGPLVSINDPHAFEAGRLVVEGELALARDEPFRALALLRQARPLPPAWSEAALSVESRAWASLELAPETLAGPEKPAAMGPGLADRAVALASLLRTNAAAQHPSRETFARLAQRLEDAGLRVRAARLAILEAFLGGDSPASRERLARALSVEDGREARGPSALMTVASRVVLAGWAAGRREHSAVLEATSIAQGKRSGAPGDLLATLHLLAARAAFSLGRHRLASEMVREGLLDLQEADMSEVTTPPEFLVIQRAFGDPSTDLPGIAFAAALATGGNRSLAAAKLVRNLGRAARSWSTSGASWPDQLGEITRSIGEHACLVVATPEPLAPALALTMKRAPVTASRAEIVQTAPCRDATVVYWLGPAAPLGGLHPHSSDRQVLVRLVAPLPLLEKGMPTSEELTTREVGPGLDRPLRRAVQSTVPESKGDSPGISRAVLRLEESWPVFHGAGVASSRTPLASGWLVPHGLNARGWIGPQDIPGVTPANGAGLVAVGLKMIVTHPGAEKGAWLISEEALASGHPWVLLSRQPLTFRQRTRLIARLPYWRKDPLGEALRLCRGDRELAERLTLWASPGTLPPPSKSEWLWFLLSGGAALLAAFTFVLWRFRRRSRRSRERH